jgi:hypothetical protein
MKMKEMIMPGIMSEGSDVGSDPTYGARLGSRWMRLRAWDRRQFPARFERRRGTGCCKWFWRSEAPNIRSVWAERTRHGNTGPAEAQPLAVPAIGRALLPGT